MRRRFKVSPSSGFSTRKRIWGRDAMLRRIGSSPARTILALKLEATNRKPRPVSALTTHETPARDQGAMGNDARRHRHGEAGIAGGPGLRQAVRPKIPVLGDQEDQLRSFACLRA